MLRRVSPFLWVQILGCQRKKKDGEVLIYESDCFVVVKTESLLYIPYLYIILLPTKKQAFILFCF